MPSRPALLTLLSLLLAGIAGTLWTLRPQKHEAAAASFERAQSAARIGHGFGHRTSDDRGEVSAVGAGDDVPAIEKHAAVAVVVDEGDRSVGVEVEHGGVGVGRCITHRASLPGAAPSATLA